MRLWSIHPKYLDSKGLVALWRETLLAKNVLEGKTKGYKNHPQLHRFKNSENPIAAINCFLQEIYAESLRRGFQFDRSKFTEASIANQITVTAGQMQYEVEHLKKKLEVRDHEKYLDLESIPKFIPHPLFRITPGKIEDWEIL